MKQIKAWPALRKGLEVTYEAEEGYALVGTITDMMYDETKKHWQYFVKESKEQDIGHWLIESEILQILPSLSFPIE